LVRCDGQDEYQGDLTLATHQELSRFLAEIERRAFKHAAFAVRDDHAALDITQDSMMKLAEKYPDRPVEEYPMLFHRILQNTIHDHFRRQKVRSTWTTLLSMLSGKQDDRNDDYDPLETLEVDEDASPFDTPHRWLERSQLAMLIEEGVQNLPARQREAFLMRYWEDMDVAETAAAMGCSEGSVKTHSFRATHALAAFLKSRGIEP
jgi:RNA polymerase sigma-70 factor (ECF subfamily)